MKKYITTMLLVICLSLVGLTLYLEDRDKDSSVQASIDASFKPKVDFTTITSTLPNLEDTQVSFAGKQNKLQLINFWASWCGPCIIEAPDLVKLHEQFGDKITIYAINSTANDREREARKFVDEHGFEFEVLFDRDNVFTDLYMIKTYPTSFVIDQDGVIRERINGVISFDEWQRIIEKWS